MREDILVESRHIIEFLDVNKDQLFHWVKTKGLVKPHVEGKGRGGRSKFSFENLLDLVLIANKITIVETSRNTSVIIKLERMLFDYLSLV